MTSKAVQATPANEGARERKQRETRLRITQTALKLFLADGYESTTIDAIAQGAGISRRTFFSYFKSKEDVVVAWQAASWEAVLADVTTASPDEAPLDAVRQVLVKHATRFESNQMKAIDRMMLASETLMARKQASYAAQEASLHGALCEVWRQPHRRTGLRVVAMVSIGAMRLAIEAWRQQGGRGDKPVAHFVENAFTDLKAEI